MKLIANFSNQQVTFDYSFNDKWIEIKTKLIKLFKLNVDYIDLEFINERPIREFGKQALILGFLERIYDDYYISEFITKDKELHFNIHLVELSQKEKVQVIKTKQENCLFTDNDFPLLSIK
jgi:hypothetical protein